jgi:hypothetical protein
MKLRAYSWICRTLQNTWWALVITACIFLHLWQTRTERPKKSFRKPLSKGAGKTSRELSSLGVGMNAPNTMFINGLRRTQEFMKKKYLSAEAKYCDIIDDLTEKLNDMDIKDTPDLSFKGFDFIEDWENGTVSSAHVNSILEKINPTEVAHKQITRRLTSYMFQNEQSAEYIKGLLPLLKTTVCPVYESYLKFMKIYFRKVASLDAEQELVTWLEVVVDKDNSLATYIRDVTLNQVIRQLDAYFLNDLDDSYFFNKNVIAIHENVGRGERTTHWLFAPNAYIEKLKEMYDIDKELDIEGDESYIRALVKEFAK